MRQLSLLIWLGFIQAPALAAERPPAPDERPNILLIVADDLGYADLGAFGSDIATPTIDALAADGIRFTGFRTAPSCAPTRAMLLTGNNNHVAGMAKQDSNGLLGTMVPGYESALSDRIVPFPKLLREAGYDTYMVGKWHLGLAPANWPVTAGFERSFSLLQGGGNHFNDLGYYAGGAQYVEDDAYAEWPEGGYSTTVYTDRLIEFIDADRENGQPFFAYAAYTSPHWPLQVPDEYLDRYAGRYDDGYDVLRERNFEALKAAGILVDNHELPPRNEAVKPWAELTPAEQRRESRKMELYAAMVENLDDEIGRLFKYLHDNDLYDNTLIVFMSDNGAAFSDFYNIGPFAPYLQSTHDNAYELMGTAKSFVSYGIPWGEAGSAPFRRYKTHSTEGGIAAPMIIAGAGVEHENRIDRQHVTVMDLAPTFLDVARTTYPESEALRPMQGESMLAYLAGSAERVHADDYVTLLSNWGRAHLRRGDWKIATLEPPFVEADFELYNLADDPGETTNLAAEEPEKYRELIELWRAKRREYGIILPEDL